MPSSHPMGNTSDGGGPVACDYFSGVFEYIERILMEEDEGNWSTSIEHRDCDLEGYFHDVFTNAVADSDNRKSERRNTNDDAERDTEEQGHRRKQVALDSGEAEAGAPDTSYDKALLCPKMNPRFYDDKPLAGEEDQEASEDDISNKYVKPPELKRGRPKKGSSKKHTNVKEMIDLTSLVSQAAKAVSVFDTDTARQVLTQIKRHSSPFGDPRERLAHYFASALEARIEGAGSMLHNAFTRIQPAQLLKCYQTYFRACPFQRMSNIIANKTIALHTKEADRIHIIDFGITDGFQWPCIIQGLSLKPGGPPHLKITGIDFPQAGLKPAARVEQTGKWLMSFCKRFDLPFAYHSIAKKWDEIRPDDLRIETNEMLVVNCMYQMKHVLEESGSLHLESPRDSVLNLIRRIRPCIFVHGVSNADHGVPFFTTRFTEALHHYSCMFDMLEATIPREDMERQVYEREILGNEIMNVMACESSERVERPETYKKWQVRDQRAGFEQLPLNKEILQEAMTKVKRSYHGDFFVEEDGKWILQGWKGRVLYALSLWTPAS